MERGRRRRRRIVIGALLCLTALTTLGVNHLLNLRKYAFLRIFSAERRDSDGYAGHRWTGAHPNDLYRFAKPADDVLRSMTKELKADGWNRVYEDAEYTAFTRKGPTGDEIADFTRVALFGFDRGKDESTTCIVTLPSNETWLSEQMESLGKRFGWVAKQKPFPALGVGGDCSFEVVTSSGAGPAVATLTWRNRSRDVVTATVSNLFLQGYECEEPLPLKVILTGWTTHKVNLTFPSMEQTEESRLSYVYDYRSTSGYGGGGAIGFAPSPRATVVKGKGLDREVVVTNLSPTRTMLLRNVRVSIDNGVPSKAISASLSGNKTSLRIPVRLSGTSSGKPPEVRVSGSCRLLPNKQWVPFTIRA